MDLEKKKLSELAAELGRQLASLKKNREKLVPVHHEVQGSLVIRNSKKCTEYLIYKGKDNPPEYISRTRTDIIAPLAQKRYDEKLRGVIGKRIKALGECIDVLERFLKLEDVTDVYSSFPAELKEYVEPYEGNDEKFAKRWQSIDFGKWSSGIHSKYVTQRGDRVRSKSEVIIADRLYSKGIPYHYETLFACSDGSMTSPDFRILNKRTRKQYFWEHFGMMDDPDYCFHAIEKIEKYADSDVVLGENLIVSFESSLKYLSTEYIDTMIREYFE